MDGIQDSLSSSPADILATDIRLWIAMMEREGDPDRGVVSYWNKIVQVLRLQYADDFINVDELRAMLIHAMARQAGDRRRKEAMDFLEEMLNSFFGIYGDQESSYQEERLTVEEGT
jgi:hypothetical protein